MGSVDDVGRRQESARVHVGSVATARATTRASFQRARAPLLALGMLALVTGALGGLARLGWLAGVPVPSIAAFHGPLMVAAFLGTVISLERAVALRAWWAYAAPVATGLGGVALIVGTPAGAWLTTAGSAVVVIVFAVLLTRQRALFTAVMALGALTWLVGQVLWLSGWPVYRVVVWWIGFLVLTIAGERLELSRLVQLSAVRRTAFVAIAIALVAGLLLSLVQAASGARVLGAAMLGLAAWLGRFDIARRTVRQSGLTRFIAVSLLSGYVWLGVSGVLALAFANPAAGPLYDAILHALFLGFVFAMIFGHAPIIFPAVLGIAVTYRPAFYAHLLVLHLSLALRLAGDVVGSASARQWGALGNALAIAAFLASTAYGAAVPRRLR